ncbi:glutathione peroxidase [Candidatus Gracilibacteria bacterium]|nr:glutathione peroxidase [Candidatus Gracilibacteria bacterium]
MTSLYNILVKKPNSEQISLIEYAGKVLLIVNTATKCGLAPQFEELETLWNSYSHDDFMILGFPCNQFLSQEPETNETMESTCKLNFGVTFPLFAKIDVNGDNTHPLYQFLKQEKGGILGDDIKWNFTKFLIDQTGRVIERYAPTTSPLSMKGDIEKLL